MACVFNKQLLHPRNWLTWFGLGILWLIVQLPYPLLHFIGTSAGRLSRRFLKRREHIAGVISNSASRTCRQRRARR
ncbi:putative lipid A biosynthesis acyltransferase [Klebsiella pneumoniae]|uniref:Putative lipid A biosynthesis acyltransferase n=1 Tax=Klebsiella pneumoniae TaxID=573 RepID=A0A378F469_KLEPN|nr:putative lipid A biosynthesis acyltransferase [Klebsiella pneumoniae]